MEIVGISLIALACPLGMGLMMWFMAKGMGRKRGSKPDAGSLAEPRAEQERVAG